MNCQGSRHCRASANAREQENGAPKTTKVGTQMFGKFHCLEPDKREIEHSADGSNVWADPQPDIQLK